MHLLQSEPEGEYIPLPLLVVHGQMLKEGIVLVPPLDGFHMLEGAAVAGVPKLTLLPGH